MTFDDDVKVRRKSINADNAVYSFAGQEGLLSFIFFLSFSVYFFSVMKSICA